MSTPDDLKRIADAKAYIEKHGLTEAATKEELAATKQQLAAFGDRMAALEAALKR